MLDFIGVHGHREPFINLERHINTTNFAAIHDEICYGLSHIDVGYTGGSHKWMGIVPREFEHDQFIDYGQVIERFSKQEFLRFISLADEERDYDMANWKKYTFGEDAEIPLSAAQYRYLKFRYGVYFPWKVFFEFVEGNLNWDDKCEGDRNFSTVALTTFPLTVMFIRSLPFKSIGRCNLLGLEANDHATIHRDNYDKRESPPINDFISFCPANNKRLFLWNEHAKEKKYVEGKIYTFNDMNFHGVDAAPFFRYSIRVDGVFTDEFRTRIAVTPST